jgi:hypothetical protein
MVFVHARGPWSRRFCPRSYRLIDPLLQPHPYLDGLYDSMEEALRDAIRWVEALGPDADNPAIGLEVSTGSGDWRTILQPAQLLCPLPRPVLLSLPRPLAV